MSKPVELHYREQGSGTPLLILHGLFGSSANWGRLATRLAEDYRVIVADLRNHGRSPHDADMSYPDLAADVDALMDRLDVSSATVLGHSMGGKTAMTLALQQPDRIERLIIADIAPVPYHGDSHEGLIDALSGLDLASIGSRRDAFDALEPAIPEAGVRQFLLTNLEQGPDGWSWRVPLQYLRDNLAVVRDFPDFTSSFGQPTLFLHGGDSDYVLPEHHSAIRKLFPKSTIVGLKGCGHWLHVDDPDGFHAAVKQFLIKRET
ncbi:pimeloyl-ACP methyl ester carboxylesterase [Natronocella acetinitrilica]|uniref:Pimeloyl-ACP methyl ester carboxylesterase n=1 Tax=Natronocella acetinitrilica TaxID=414046 RepID=A0AAE3K9X3_9GAMM|nr:alpha/beta fold hydrolase [Natronocella acetinitrilica]MCP1673325.1 pimeloyl-ACP methyl ester carboxylesterase [Natronocella acetinitrilica]